MPQTGSKSQYSRNEDLRKRKEEEVADIVDMLNELSSELGISILPLDLVTKSNENRQKLLKEETNIYRKTGKHYHNVIISMQMATEGTDLPYLSRSILVGTRSSITFFLQGPFGRIIRDMKGKEEVNVHTVTPFFFDVANDKDDLMKIDKENKEFIMSCLRMDFELFSASFNETKDVDMMGKSMSSRTNSAWQDRKIRMEIYNEINNKKVSIKDLKETFERWDYIRDIAENIAIEYGCDEKLAKKYGKKIIDDYGYFSMRISGSEKHKLDVLAEDYEDLCPIGSTFDLVISNQMSEVEFLDYKKTLGVEAKNDPVQMVKLISKKMREINPNWKPGKKLLPIEKDDDGILYKWQNNIKALNLVKKSYERSN